MPSRSARAVFVLWGRKSGSDGVDLRIAKKLPRLFLAKAVNIVVTYVAGETVFLFDYALVWQ